MELLVILWLNHLCTINDCTNKPVSTICQNYDYGKSVKFSFKNNEIVCELKNV